MANEKVNKVVLGNETLIDLTPDTVTASTLALGETAHDRSGNQITGTMVGGASELSELNDVNLTSLSNGQIIKYNSTDDEWQNADNSLANLSDTVISTPANGQVITSIEENGVRAWRNSKIGIGDLSNVSLYGLKRNDVLKYSGVYFEPYSLPNASTSVAGLIQLGDGFVEGTYKGTYFDDNVTDTQITVDLTNIRTSTVPVMRVQTSASTMQPLPSIVSIVVNTVASFGMPYTDTITCDPNTVTQVIDYRDLENGQYAAKWSSLEITLQFNGNYNGLSVEGYSSKTVFTKSVSVEACKDKYSNTVSCSVGDTDVTFTDVTYSNTASYEVFGDDGKGMGRVISAIVEEPTTHKVMALFQTPLTVATTVYLKYWEI